MQTATSRDGTVIAFDQEGNGPGVILVGGGPTDRSANAPLVGLLAPELTVVNYDRRGRGDSGDRPPYAVDREVEDLRAVIAAAGGSTGLYGTSGGAVFALAAAGRGLPVTKLALWEPSYIVPGSRPAVPAGYAARLAEMISAGRRGDVLEYFFTVIVGLPAEFVAPMRTSPFWAAMEKAAHTLLYEAAIVGDYSVPTETLSRVTMPTLVIDGGQTPWLSRAADAVAAAMPNAQRRTLPGEPHNVTPDAIAPVLIEFFGA